jgi:hypothetical protein
MQRVSANDETRMTNDEIIRSSFVILHSSLKRPAGHTLIELVVAMVASTVLLAGLGSVMFIARQVAYSPSGASRRTEAADVLSQLTDELQYATLVIGQSANVLEFLVGDRDADGTAEKIRYEWSGTSGAPLRKSINGGALVTVLESVTNFNATYLLESKTTTLTPTVDTAEALLASNASVQDDGDYNINTLSFSAQQINPAAFASVPVNAISWNATKVDFYGRDNSSANETLLVQLRSTGSPNDGPTSDVLGQVSIPESTLGSDGWKSAVFASPVRGLGFHRRYAVVWAGLGSGDAARLPYGNGGANGVLESGDGGASWQFSNTRRLYWRIHGTYTTPGTPRNVTRTYITQIGIVLQAGGFSHARIDASVPLANRPELLSAYWQTDLDRDPTTTNMNGDAVADWAMAGGASFNPATLVNGVWHADGALETRPLSDFAQVTTVGLSCRNTTVGGNGAVMRINADRQGGLHAPILVYVKRQTDGTQTLSLCGKTSDSGSKELLRRARLSSDFVRVRLTIVPQYDLVNVAINNEDQGTFTYPTYTPTSPDRFLTLYADGSLAEFDYVDLRVAN